MSGGAARDLREPAVLAAESAAPPPEPLLVVKNLKKYFPVRRGFFSRAAGWVQAVDDVSFEVKRGEVVGMVGESGCGKTTVGRAILRLIEPTAGEIIFDGRNLLAASHAEMRRLRRKMQIIFQDPYGSLNPRMTIGAIVSEGPRIHGLANGKEGRERCEYLVRRVGLDPALHMDRYPHEFSGGQRQRVGIARALSLEPEFIVCDEAVSALDVSIQAQILNLLMDLQDEFRLSYLFIAHDLAVVEHLSDRVIVMYLGKIVESARAEDLYANPRHPYTRALLSAVPDPDPRRRAQRIVLAGTVPSPLHPPPGCRFHTRCPQAMARCAQEEPREFPISPEHSSNCWLEDAHDRG